MEWNGAERADVFLGPVEITLFTRAIYEDAVALPAEGFLHPALFTDDLDAELAGHDVSVGPGGRRRHRSGAAGSRSSPRPAASGSSSWSNSRPIQMKVTRFHHVSVNCHDASLDDMVAFYGGLLGLADVPRPDIPGVAGHWHGVGDQQLHLVGAPPRGTPIDSTGNHYCVAVDDLDAAIAELDARGHRVSAWRPGRVDGADLDQRPRRQHHRAPTGDRVTPYVFTPYDRPVRAAFVGLGRIYDLNVRAYLDNPDVEVVALVDPSEERRAQRARRGPTRTPSRRSTSWPRAGSRSTRSRHCSRYPCTSTAWSSCSATAGT